eukprot:NODE_2023_length_1321_cov_37.459906_g1839_i0.p1 GENE.NODE_2023_length_1321_cov_37.459906_g1839_i0~~NODE_2023_length_1321_cov_37.459906_g1839_i0.p1  ORF type:complete len:381 (+),score=54.22 NODE_2023_length_1321_cov_37.459906_g1839_i0:125-1267(+)
MTLDLLVRDLGPADIATIRSLFRAGLMSCVRPEDGVLYDEFEAYVARSLNSDFAADTILECYTKAARSAYLVAEDRSTRKVVGGVGMHPVEVGDPEFAMTLPEVERSKVCEVRRMTVDIHWQRCGIAQLLMEALEDRARVHKYEIMRAVTSSQQQAACRLYDRRGFTRSKLIAHSPELTLVPFTKCISTRPLLVRDCTAQDEEALRALLAAGIMGYVTPEDGQIFKEFGDYTKAALASDFSDIVGNYVKAPRSAYLIAEDPTTGRIVGGVGLHPVEVGDPGYAANLSLEQRSQVCELRRMTVDSMFRRRGVGSQLLQLFEARAIQLGYRSIHLTTASNQTTTPAFYAACGFALEKATNPTVLPHQAIPLHHFVKRLASAL